jgi:hypothetical protein
MGLNSFSWIVTHYPSGDNTVVCQKNNEISFGFFRQYIASCASGVALVQLYVHDGQFSSNQIKLND